MRRSHLFLATAFCLVFVVSTVRADDNFLTITATPTSGTPIVVGGSDLVNLGKNLLQARDQFSSLSGESFSASLTYGGIRNAMILTSNSNQTSATLTIPSTGFTQTFNANDPFDLAHAVTNFLKQDGSQAYSNFLAYADANSPVAAIDGNPASSTAVIADNAYNRFGINPTLGSGPADRGPGSDIHFAISGSSIQSTGINGYDTDVSLDGGSRIGDHFAIDNGAMFQYENIGGSEAYTVADVLGLPITIFNAPARGTGFSWTLTPWGDVGFSASYDEIAGTLLAGVGGTSNAALHLGDFTFTLANQIGYNTDINVQVDGYSFYAPVDQWIAKNGVDLAWQPDQGPFFLDASVSYSDFLRAAAVPDYWSVTAGGGVKLARDAGLHLYYQGDFGPDFNANGAELDFFLAF